ncbi:MAG: glycine cleavage system aminomethyltransferase GcvT [Planctomycetota bacterium]
MHQTPLNAFHREQKARLVDFVGWEMPVVYSGIIEEHNACRQHWALFDVSHMGRVEFRGPDAERLLERLNTRNIAQATPGQCRYSHMCRGDGGILDDVIVSKFEDHFLVVCNASNREKLLAWWEEQRRGYNVEITDRTFETAMVALQGPEALPTLDQLLPMPVSDLKRYRFKTGEIMGVSYFVARSGYTGEDGAEIILPAGMAMPAVQMLISRAAGLGRPIKPAGLGARDTLRLEAGMPLYGHELTEDWDSLTAGQEWAVDLTKDFIGVEVLRKLKAEGLRRRVVGLEVAGKRIARQGAPILRGGAAPRNADAHVGVVTSGTQSPTLGKNIAMGLLRTDLAAPGTRVEIDIRGTNAAAKVVPLPFYKLPKR